jgi:hypothetical protein
MCISGFGEPFLVCKDHLFPPEADTESNLSVWWRRVIERMDLPPRPLELPEDGTRGGADAIKANLLLDLLLRP